MLKMPVFLFILILSLQSHAGSDEALRAKIAWENEVLTILHNEVSTTSDEGRNVNINQNISPWEQMNEFLSLSTIDEYFF